MREIKFRAWIPGDHWLKMGESSGYCYDWQDSTFVETMCFVPDEQEGIVIEQFTGLRDKNGVEIYEGDILLAAGSALHFVVKWITEWARFMLEDHRKWLVPLESSLLEVVGNIHENPELLETGDA